MKCQISKIISFTTSNNRTLYEQYHDRERLVQKHPVPTVPFVIATINSEHHKDRDGYGVLLGRKRGEGFVQFFLSICNLYL